MKKLSVEERMDLVNELRFIMCQSMILIENNNRSVPYGISVLYSVMPKRKKDKVLIEMWITELLKDNILDQLNINFKDRWSEILNILRG